MSRKCFYGLLAIGLFTLVLAPAFAAPQMTVQVSPQAWIPYGNSTGIVMDGQDMELYSAGYGLNLCAGMSILGFMEPFMEAGVNSIPINGVAGKSLLYGMGGGGLAVFAFPMPRLIARVGAGGGLAYANVPKTSLDDAISGSAPYWKAKAELGYRFSPSFSVLANAGYSQLLGSESAIFKGFCAGIVLNIGLDGLGGGGSGLETGIERQETVFPIVYYKSEKNPIAYLTLGNKESAEIREVRVGFSAGAYTSRSAECGEYPIILHNGSVTVPIYANFNDKVLGFTETTKIQGDIRIEYKILDSSRSVSKAITIVLGSRNAATWADPRVVAAFISPQDPVMLEISKYLAGLVRVHARPEIDKFLQYGMGIFEGLRVYGLVWTADPTIPYAVARGDARRLAYLQYPYQTLSYKSGDSDALAFAVAEALESVAVPAAIAALDEDVIVAFPLSMNEAQARTSFSNLGNFIFDSGMVWVPLRVSMIRDGFMRAWQAGAELWKARSVGQVPRLVKIEEAWKEYLPIALADVDYQPVKPNEEAVIHAFENVLGRFVGVEVDYKVKRIRAGIQGEGSSRQLNAIGIVYAQYGLYTQAKAEFEKAAAKDSEAAIVNLANVAFLLKDYETAVAYFAKALEAKPDNKAALMGLARAHYELDSYSEADELFARARSLDPSLAERYAYLSSKVDAGQALRASSAAADRGGGMTWDQEE